MSGAARALHWRDQRVCASYSDKSGKPSEPFSCLGLAIAIVRHERGIPSKHKSSACVDYVPALCTHRPSLLPIGCFSEVFGLVGAAASVAALCRKDDQTWTSRGSKSRNKVSVGEPAEGSLRIDNICEIYTNNNNTIVKTKIIKTFNNGSLGSRIDEERSETRYFLWIAEVNHQFLNAHCTLGYPPKYTCLSVVSLLELHCFSKILNQIRLKNNTIQPQIK